MGGWAIVVQFLFPIPLVALLILCLPLPEVIAGPIRHFTNLVLVKVLFPPLINGFNLYQIATFISALLFIESAMATSKYQDRQLHIKDERTLCIKWRNERNFWIAFMSLVLWLILHRVHKMTQDLEKYKAAIREEEKPHSH